MADPQLLAQIRVQRQAGISDAEIRKVLHIQGFSVAEATEAIAEAAAIANVAMAPHLPQAIVPPVTMVMPHAITEPPPLSVAPVQFKPVDIPTVAPVPIAAPLAAPLSPEPVFTTAAIAPAVVTPQSRGGGRKIAIIALVLILFAAGSVVFAYVSKIGPFSDSAMIS